MDVSGAGSVVLWPTADLSSLLILWHFGDRKTLKQTEVLLELGPQ